MAVVVVVVVGGESGTSRRSQRSRTIRQLERKELKAEGREGFGTELWRMMVEGREWRRDRREEGVGGRRGGEEGRGEGVAGEREGEEEEVAEGRDDRTSWYRGGRPSISAESFFDRFNIVTHWSEEDISSL